MEAQLRVAQTATKRRQEEVPISPVGLCAAKKPKITINVSRTHVGEDISLQTAAEPECSRSGALECVANVTTSLMRSCQVRADAEAAPAVDGKDEQGSSHSNVALSNIHNGASDIFRKDSVQ